MLTNNKIAIERSRLRLSVAYGVITLFSAFFVTVGISLIGRGVSASMESIVYSGTALVLGTMLGLVWLGTSVVGAEAVSNLPSALAAAKGEIADLDVVRKEYYKLRTSIESLSEGIHAEMQTLEAVTAKIDDVMNERHKVVQMAELLKRWREAAELFVDALEAMVRLDGLSPEQRRCAEKLARDFMRCFSPIGLEVICPEPGSQFDDRVHQAEGEEENGDYLPGTIVRCSAWGIRDRDTVTRKASVVLARPLH